MDPVWISSLTLKFWEVQWNAYSFFGVAASPHWIMTQMSDFNPPIVCRTLLLSTEEDVVQLCCFAFKINAHSLNLLHDFFSDLFDVGPADMHLRITVK